MKPMSQHSVTSAVTIPALTPSSVNTVPTFASITTVTIRRASTAGTTMVATTTPGFITVSWSVRLTTQSAKASADSLRSIGHGHDLYGKNDVGAWTEIRSI